MAFTNADRRKSPNPENLPPKVEDKRRWKKEAGHSVLAPTKILLREIDTRYFMGGCEVTSISSTLLGRHQRIKIEPGRVHGGPVCDQS